MFVSSDDARTRFRVCFEWFVTCRLKPTLLSVAVLPATVTSVDASQTLIASLYIPIAW
jgi:hypothetical protein